MDIYIDDFVASKIARRCCGFVVRRASVPFGKQRIDRYMIRLANGREEFIPAADIELIAPATFDDLDTLADGAT
jgi:hypothetical protein